jgi:lipopolysaccharide transport system ATP-binding protein
VYQNKPPLSPGEVLAVRESADDIAVRVNNLGKCYQIYDTPRDRLKQFIAPRLQRLGGQNPKQYFREFWALKDISFEVKKGECLGIIGRNGSGKSTLLQIIAGTLAPTTGSLNANGKVAALLELGSGFNPEFTGRENVYMNGAIIGLSRVEMDKKIAGIAAFADIGDFIDQPVKIYSSGMFMRLAFAVQVHIDASIVIIDEALAVGDVFFTQKCFSRLRELVDSGAAVILVTHDMATVTQFCSRVLVLNMGQEMYQGDPVSAIRRYMSLQRDIGASIPRRAQLPRELVSDNANKKATAIELKWPPADAFFDIRSADIVGNGQAEFMGVALCNADGEPTRLFQIGECADFFVEYRLLGDIDVPIGGVTIVNEKGILVHGKNSMQYRIGAPAMCRRGATLRFRQRIVMDVTPGEYTFVVGLATIDGDTYQNCEHMSHGDLSNSTQRILSVGNAGAFTVSLCRDGMALKHHGLANLPGECELVVMNSDEEGGDSDGTKS